MILLHEQVNVAGVVQDITALNPPTGANGAMLQADDLGDVNYTMDGSFQPGASAGMILHAGLEPEEFKVEDIRNIRFVKSGADTVLRVHWFGGRAI